ncbi:spop [Symbiodinium sp. KB8]|nr:spop [Symbiodinium sp. KB8]
MGVRGLLSYVLRHADAMTQRVDLAQEAQYYGRNGVTLLVDILDFCARFLPEVDRGAKGWEGDATVQVCGSDFVQHDEALCELIFALRHAGQKGETVLIAGIYLEFFLDPPRGCGLLDAATSAWTEEALRPLSRKKGDPVTSGPIIEIGDSKWEILVYPSGNERCKDGWIRVSVRCTEGEQEVRALYSVSVVNAAGEVKHRLEEEATFTSGDGWGFDNFIRQERLTDRTKGFADDVVIFEATVTVLGREEIRRQPITGSESKMIHSEELASDLKALWESGQHADLTLQVGETQLQVHGLILAARSAVFSRMLASDMSEAKSRVIRIVDADAETMRCLCEYMYTGTVRNNRPFENADLAGSLLQAAAKYEVHGLVRWCSAKIAATLGVDTAAEWLVLASQIGPQADALKTKCVHLAASNLSEVQVTEGWQRFMKNPRVLNPAWCDMRMNTRHEWIAFDPPSVMQWGTGYRKCAGHQPSTWKEEAASLPGALVRQLIFDISRQLYQRAMLLGRKAHFCFACLIGNFAAVQMDRPKMMNCFVYVCWHDECVALECRRAIPLAPDKAGGQDIGAAQSGRMFGALCEPWHLEVSDNIDWAVCQGVKLIPLQFFDLDGIVKLKSMEGGGMGWPDVDSFSVAYTSSDVIAEYLRLGHPPKEEDLKEYERKGKSKGSFGRRGWPMKWWYDSVLIELALLFGTDATTPFIQKHKLYQQIGLRMGQDPIESITRWFRDQLYSRKLRWKEVYLEAEKGRGALSPVLADLAEKAVAIDSSLHQANQERAKELPVTSSLLLRSAALADKVWLDVHLEDVSRLGAPVSTQLFSDLRRVLYQLLGRDSITETKGDHSGVTASKMVLSDAGSLPDAKDRCMMRSNSKQLRADDMSGHQTTPFVSQRRTVGRHIRSYVARRCSLASGRCEHIALQVSWAGNVTAHRLFKDGLGRIDGKCSYLGHASTFVR